MGKWENKIEKYLATEIENIGGTCRKWVSPGRRGVPDQIVMLKGYTCYVETKTGNGRVESWQEREHKRLRDAGNLVFVLWSELQINKFVSMLKKHVELIEITMDKLKEQLK